MGLWDIISTQQLVVPGVIPTLPGTDQYGLMQKYFGAESEMQDYDKGEFNQRIQEAKNLGLVIPKDVEKAFKELAKNGGNWFYLDGSLQEGLSDKDAKKAKKYRAVASTYYQKIKPEPQENVRARWAARNYITNGFDTSSAKLYSAITNYNQLANLWGGDIKGALSGGYYGSKAQANEQAYYNKLTAPQKRAYLLLRKQWVDQGLIKPYTGIDTNNLTMVTSADMENYMRDHINDWLYGFYGDNGYDDEYESIHNPDLLSASLYAKYGLTPTSNNGAWVPKGTIRMNGFTSTKIKNSTGASKVRVSNTGASGSRQSTSTTSNTENSSVTNGTSNSDDSLKEITELDIKQGLRDGSYNYKGYQVDVKNGKLYSGGQSLKQSKNGYLYYDKDGLRFTVGYNDGERIIGNIDGNTSWRNKIKNSFLHPLYKHIDFSKPVKTEPGYVIYTDMRKGKNNAILVDRKSGSIIPGTYDNNRFTPGIWGYN